MLVYLAYNAARPSPQTVTPGPMLLPVLTTPGNAFEAWDAWMKTGATRMGLYVHHDDDFMFVLPKLDVHQAARRVLYAVASGRARVLYMEAFPLWPLDGQVPYVLAELSWDPRQDVDALLADYYATLFGPAAAPMRSFYEAVESGYERWLQQRGLPHWHGPDISATTDARDLRQFEVLTIEEAARASDALARAATAAGTDARAAERVRVVQWMFGLIEKGVRQYWTTVRLRGGAVLSEGDTLRVANDAREILNLDQAMKDYVTQTLERPPASDYHLFVHRGPAHSNDSLDRARSGRSDPAVNVAITFAMNAAADVLRLHMGAERAGAWWRSLRAKEKNPRMITALEGAEIRSRGIEAQNLVDDPGFEAFGNELLSDPLGPEGEATLDRSLEARLGIVTWLAEGSSFRAALSGRESHSGRFSLMLEGSPRTAVIRLVRGKPGQRFRVGFWFMHNRAPGRYRFTVEAEGAGSTSTLASGEIGEQPGEWRGLSADAILPPNMTNLRLRVQVDAQSRDARCWLDDLLIGMDVVLPPDRP